MGEIWRDHDNHYTKRGRSYWNGGSPKLNETKQLNRTVSEPKSAGIIGDRRGSHSRESSSTADGTQESDFSNWLDQQILDAENIQDGKRWWSPPSSQPSVSKLLYRTSTYPQQPLLQQKLSEPIFVPKSSFTPPHHISHTYSHIPLSANCFSLDKISHHLLHLHLPGFPRDIPHGGNMTHFAPSDLSIKRGRHNH
ncbi:hypothetical protein M5K25_013594 [Dendrobium thyrsiflorum]|uniref:Uncharacterized protein n=1 Tax=Dendrobium thyrsiflorum TaxID=117978 RepID=A0ABD0UTN7_DENTH